MTSNSMFPEGFLFFSSVFSRPEAGMLLEIPVQFVPTTKTVG